LKKATVLVRGKPLQTTLMFACKAKSLRVEHLKSASLW
jgi:hypothetical protein